MPVRGRRGCPRRRCSELAPGLICGTAANQKQDREHHRRRTLRESRAVANIPALATGAGCATGERQVAGDRCRRVVLFFTLMRQHGRAGAARPGGGAALWRLTGDRRMVSCGVLLSGRTPALVTVRPRRLTKVRTASARAADTPRAHELIQRGRADPSRFHPGMPISSLPALVLLCARSADARTCHHEPRA